MSLNDLINILFVLAVFGFIIDHFKKRSKKKAAQKELAAQKEKQNQLNIDDFRITLIGLEKEIVDNIIKKTDQRFAEKTQWFDWYANEVIKKSTALLNDKDPEITKDISEDIMEKTKTVMNWSKLPNEMMKAKGIKSLNQKNAGGKRKKRGKQ